MHGAKGKRKRKQKGHLAFQVPFLHVLARSHENGTNGGLTNELYEILKVQRIASVVGPRQCGKTTLVESADIRNADFISLDRTEDLTAARLDPRYLLTRKPGSCVVIDEIQKAPELIGEIKYLVDHDPRPGQFVLTGSADYRKLPHARESLAGRVDFLRLRTFTAAEILGARPCFLEKALAGDLRFDVDPSTCGKPHILDLAIRGGYPRVALETGLPNEARARWFESYIAWISQNPVRCSPEPQFRRANIFYDSPDGLGLFRLPFGRPGPRF